MSANPADQHTGSLPQLADLIPEPLSSRWEDSYKQYVRTVAVRATGAGEARVIAEASGAVAQTWRAISNVPGLPWWSVAAVQAAAEVFDEQAGHWHAFADHVAGRREGGR
ncbi:hypothetical protein [Actinokineospora bangkokensis]|uniref:Uncharacterized protein n=1 Tax=Actinokineospora bangkokensis TaxID=1193682 RepID=A0A1Q9LEC9_9PSEU|nr:hypothetical protein [Actinokineospora bangkokensis]OLR90391.1 hypothetical protein BJP25_27455 [Actinokineospora bangkokensis]